MKPATPAEAGLRAAEWSRRLGEASDALTGIYGRVAARPRFVESVLGAHRSRFGDDPVRSFRSPGRINLRGMHVDTHGGIINPMTCDRETIVIARASGDARLELFNVDSSHESVEGAIGDAPVDPAGWARYVWGCVAVVRGYLVRESLGDGPMVGLRGTVGSDIPIGAGLSSSASLCASLILALLGVNGRCASKPELVGLIRDAEWAAGARCGLGDPGAIVYGDEGELLRMAFRGDATEPDVLDRCAWPDEMVVYVIDSGVRRSIGGAQRVAYSANRAAYSCALEVLRGELLRRGATAECVREIRDFRDCTREALEGVANGESVFRLLAAIPEYATLTAIESMIGEAAFNRAFDAQLGDIERGQWPEGCALRGPLTYGLAESERGRVFMDAIRRGDTAFAGGLMSVGHEGDRARASTSTTDENLERMAVEKASLHDCPGAYGASTGELDVLVDGAMACGAAGASLTGAGLGGSIVVLCREETAEKVGRELELFLEGCSGGGEIRPSFARNYPIAGAGELRL